MRTAIFYVLAGVLLVSCRTANTPEAATEKSVGNQWCKAKLASQDGIQISLDFRAHWDHGYIASPLWLNVNGSSLNAQKTIRVEIQSNAIAAHAADGVEVLEKRQLKLDFDAKQNKFTKEVPNGLVIMRDEMGTQTKTNQSVQITVDGRALMDPISGTDRFSVQLLSAMTAQNCL